MNPYAVRITPRALADMEAIHTYIAQELLAPEAAIRQYNRIADAIEALARFPQRHRLFESQPERQYGMRLMPIDNYAVIYTTDDTTVTVLRVLYGKSDIIARLRDQR